MSEPETLEQIAERLDVGWSPHRLGCIRYACDEEDLPTDCDCEHGVVRAVILAALREVEARTLELCDWQNERNKERAEKAEAERDAALKDNEKSETLGLGHFRAKVAAKIRRLK